MPRDLGTIPASWLSDDRVRYHNFLRMDWPAPLGTLRWTDYGADSYTADVGDGAGAVDWDGTWVWDVGALQQGAQNIGTISFLKFGNANNTWSDWLKTYDVTAVRFRITILFFDKDDWTIVKGPFEIFDGLGDRAEVGDDVNLSLVPNLHPMLVKFPRRRYTPAFGFAFLPPPNFKLPWGTAQASLPNSGPPGTIFDPYGNWTKSSQPPPPPPVVPPPDPGGGRTGPNNLPPRPPPPIVGFR